MATLKTTNRKIKTQKALYNTILYISKSEKVSEICFANGDNFTTANNCAETFEKIRKAFNKDDGLLAHHFIQSWSPKENISHQQAQQISLEFAQKAFPNYEAIVATHKDTDHIHTHIILNSVNSATGEKYHDCKDTLHYLRNLSNEICKEHGLSTLPLTGSKGIDQQTFHAENSWKKKLLEDLDEALLCCKSKKDFMQFMYLRSYSVKYTEKNITITKDGEKKGVRVDTLAKQFKNDKYTKRSLERAMGYFKPLTNEEREEKVKTISERKEQAKIKKSEYNGEWARFEKYLFEQINKPEIIETDKFMSNISLKEILESQGKNFKGEIDLLELIKLKELDCFFYARKFELTAIVMVKEYNEEKLKSTVTVLDKANKILLEQKKEKSLNAKINAEIKKTAQERREKPCYRIVEQVHFERLKKSGAKFAYFEKEGKYNIVFLKEDEQKINQAVKGVRLEA